MCKLCKYIVCPPSCPNHRTLSTPKTVVRCVGCGERIADGKRYFQANGFPYCEYCLRFSDLESIIRICGISLNKGLENLGFSSCIH